MRVEQITSQLILIVEKFQLLFNAARFGALRDLPGNPYQVEIQNFGHALAVKHRSTQLRGKQRVVGFKAADSIHLDELLQWYRQDQLRYSIQLDYGEINESLFRRFAAAGLISRGSGAAHVWMGPIDPQPPIAGLVLRESHADERELYLSLFQRCFANRAEENPQYRPIQWAEDALPEGKRYIAELDARPVAFGSMPIIEGIAICSTGGTLPEFRGRGIQRRLLECRIATAARLGCSLLLGGADLDSAAHRNFVRCGFRMLPLGMSWFDAPQSAPPAKGSQP